MGTWIDKVLIKPFVPYTRSDQRQAGIKSKSDMAVAISLADSKRLDGFIEVSMDLEHTAEPDHVEHALDFGARAK